MGLGITGCDGDNRISSAVLSINLASRLCGKANEHGNADTAA